jgi:hypothetical protein
MKRMFGERVGRWCAAAAEIAAGETDLVADRIGGQKDDPTQLFAARKRRLIASRMIASQAMRRAADNVVPPCDVRVERVCDQTDCVLVAGRIGVSCDRDFPAHYYGLLGTRQ